MKLVHGVAFLLLVIGGLNWGLIGLFNFNLVAALVGAVPPVEKVVYILVGASAVYIALTHSGYCKLCSGKK
ncbi:DUF378 domain-containing protein [Patescibacteria group bacterium]|nr:DUF378 domain-containing protein [Patescibacteria group bacterium]